VLDGYSDPDAVPACENEPARWSDLIGQPTGRDWRISSRGESRTEVGLGGEFRALNHRVDRITHREPGRRIDRRKWIGR
jgi:hypothetical protein